MAARNDLQTAVRDCHESGSSTTFRKLLKWLRMNKASAQQMNGGFELIRKQSVRTFPLGREVSGNSTQTIDFRFFGP